MTNDMLIDAVVRQTTVLLAHLATASGGRSTLAHLANEMFLSLTRELKAQGVGNKVVADMFGMLLRSYHKKVRRLAESSSVRGQSLWGAVLEYLREHTEASRADIMKRFAYDDEEVVRGVLHDLTDSGLASTSGRGASAVYRLVPDAFADVGDGDARREALEELLAVAVYRTGPTSLADLADHLGTQADRIAGPLAALVASGRAREIRQGDAVCYAADTYFVPFGSAVGWEAAVFDHYQAVVTTILRRLDTTRRGADPDGITGGSTYAFDLWPGHPMEQAVLSRLRSMRDELTVLRRDTDEYNAEHPPGDDGYRVTIYHGQSLLRDE